MTGMQRLWPLGVVWLMVFGLTPEVGLAQESESAFLAQELVEFMEKAELRSFAARDTGLEDDRYVAALYFPGQLLIVSARYEVPVYVEEKLTEKQYQEVYADLNQASIPGSRAFITDSSANGLQARRSGGEPFDRYDAAGQQLRFDGDWGQQQMSEENYMKAFSDADAQYTRMLEALLTEIR